jgi:peroxiredoxin
MRVDLDVACRVAIRRLQSKLQKSWRLQRMALKVGDAAPDFEVPAVTGKDKSKLKLSDFRGKKNVVIAFYPLDWTPV